MYKYKILTHDFHSGQHRSWGQIGQASYRPDAISLALIQRRPTKVLDWHDNLAFESGMDANKRP